MADKRERMPRPAAVSDLLNAVFRGKPAERRLKEGAIWVAWDSAVGPQIAAKAHPVSFRDGILTVAVSSAPWMQQLTFLKKGIVEKLNALVGDQLVQEIYLKAGRGAVLQAPHRQRKKPKRPLTAAERERIAERCALLQDPELRDAFASLLERHLSDRESDEE